MKGKTFVCAGCECRVPADYAHSEAPQFCFLCHVSEAEHEEMERIVAEVYAQ